MHSNWTYTARKPSEYHHSLSSHTSIGALNGNCSIRKLALSSSYRSSSSRGMQDRSMKVHLLGSHIHCLSTVYSTEHENLNLWRTIHTMTTANHITATQRTQVANASHFPSKCALRGIEPQLDGSSKA